MVEGPRAIADAIATGATPTVLLVRDGDDQLLVEVRATAAMPVRRVAPSLFKQVVDTVTPQGIVAEFPFPVPATATDGPPLLLVLDGVRDPGNLGTLIRAAAGAGVTQMVVTAGSADPYQPKAVRAAVGAHFRVPIGISPSDELVATLMGIPARIVADAGATVAFDEVDWTGAAALIVGSEHAGVSDAARSIATQSVAIPLARGVESLNAGVAGSIMLFEAARQRRKGRGDEEC